MKLVKEKWHKASLGNYLKMECEKAREETIITDNQKRILKIPQDL